MKADPEAGLEHRRLKVEHIVWQRITIAQVNWLAPYQLIVNGG